MERQVLLGAPSLTGKGIHDAVADAFAGDPFPLEVKVTNLTVVPLSFSEVRLHLDPCFGANPAKNVTFKDADQLARMLTDVRQIAELSQYSHMLTISDIDEVIAEVAAEPVLNPVPALESDQNDEALEAEPEPVVIAEVKAPPVLADADGFVYVPPVEPVEVTSDEPPAPGFDAAPAAEPAAADGDVAPAAELVESTEIKVDAPVEASPVAAKPKKKGSK